MTTFESNIHNIYGEEGEKWLSNLPKLITDIASRLSLRDLKPVSNLSYNYVLSGFQGDVPIILKTSLDSTSLNKEAEALSCFADFGAVNILAEEEGYLLLQRSVPGISLRTYFPARDQEAIAIAGKVMNKLHQANIPEYHSFPHVKDWLSVLDKDWEIPTAYSQKARRLGAQLLASSGPDVLLHGDLHHDNILQNGNDWIVIDPKGNIGEPAYEVAAFIRNPIPELLMGDNIVGIIQNRIGGFSKALHIPITRIASWCFVQAVLSWVWAVEDKDNTKYWEKITNFFDAVR